MKFSTTLKESFTMIKWDLSLECKYALKYAKLLMWFIIVTERREKSYDNSIDAEKFFEKSQHLFMIKKETLNKLSTEGIHFNK